MVGITVMLIMLTAAAQSWTFRIRREMERELIFRGEQYVKGLQLWRDKTGGFPVGDLKPLAEKGPDGSRVMRKLYTNPLDKEGRWQYLLLHPGGNGFINPCANTGAAAFAAQSALGQVPVPGVNLGGQSPFGGGLTQQASVPGQARSSSFRNGANAADPFSGLSAMSPEIYAATIKGMNLAIVGVVNCQQEASIRTYQGQAWLSNWAFTPLAQGEFGGNAAPGHLTGGKVNISAGIGMNSSGAFSTSDQNAIKARTPRLTSGRPEPNKQNSREGMPWLRTSGEGGEDDAGEDRYDYQWRRDEGSEDGGDAETGDWRSQRWRRDPGATGSAEPGESPSEEDDGAEGEGDEPEEKSGDDQDGEEADGEDDGDEGDGDDEEGDDEEGDDEGGDDEEGDDDGSTDDDDDGATDERLSL
jgi:hypothetical protein